MAQTSAEALTLNAGSGGSDLAVDTISTKQFQLVKPQFGGDGANIDPTVGAGVVDTGTQRITIATDDTVSVDWGGTAPPIGAGLEATALRVTLATDSTGVITANLGATDNAVLDAIAASVAGTLVVDGSGVTQPVSGTVTADLGATDNAVLDAIAASVAGTLTVGSHAVTNAGTFAVQADSVIPGTGATNLGKAIDTAAGATDTGIAPLAIRDDTLSALTPIEGDYAPLRVNSTGALHVTGGGGGTEFNVSDVAGATDAGSAMLAIRDDTLTTLTPIDGDYVRLRTNSTGALHVTGGGGGTEFNVDDALGATPAGGLSLAKRDDALSALTPVEGDAVELRVDANGALWTIPSGTVTVDGSAVTQPVSGTVTANLSATDNAVLDAIAASVAGTLTVGSHAVTNAGTFATQATLQTGANTVGEVTIGAATTAAGDLAKAEDAVHTSGDVGVMPLAVRNDVLAALAGTDGDYAPLQVNASGALFIQEGAALDVSGATLTVNSHAVTNAGTFVVQEDGASLTALQLIDNVVITHDAAGGTAVGNMMMGQRDDEVGGTATTTADGDAQALTTNKFGQLKTTPLADATSEIKYAIIDAASSGDNTLVAAAGAGIKIRVLSLMMMSAGTATARFESGAAGTALSGQMNLIANSGFSLPFNAGGWFETADNALLNLELSAAISQDGMLSYVEV